MQCPSELVVKLPRYQKGDSDKLVYSFAHYNTLHFRDGNRNYFIKCASYSPSSSVYHRVIDYVIYPKRWRGITLGLNGKYKWSEFSDKYLKMHTFKLKAYGWKRK